MMYHAEDHLFHILQGQLPLPLQLHTTAEVYDVRNRPHWCGVPWLAAFPLGHSKGIRPPYKPPLRSF